MGHSNFRQYFAFGPDFNIVLLLLQFDVKMSITRKVYHPIKFLKRFQLSKMEKYSLGRIFYKKKAGEAKQLGIDLFASTYMNFFLVHSSKENNLKQQSSLLDSKHPLHSNRIHGHCWPFSKSLKIQSVFNALIIYMTFNPFRDSEFGNGNGPGKWAKKSFLC